MTHPQDNTRVKSLVPKQPIKRVLTPSNPPSISTYTPNPFEYKYRKDYEKSQALNNAIGILNFSSRFLPSQIIGAIAKGQNFGDYIANGSQGTGNILSDFIVDIATPIGVSKIGKHKRLLPNTNLDMKVSELVNGIDTQGTFIKKGIDQGRRDVLDYYSSPVYRNKLLQLGYDEETAQRIINMKLANVANARIQPRAFSRYETKFGNYRIVDPEHIVYINENVVTDPSTARETVLHELGGHASSRGYSNNRYTRLQTVYDNLDDYVRNRDIYKIISDNNYELTPKLKESWQALANNDIEGFKALASKEDLAIAKPYIDNNSIDQLQTYISYIAEEQESTARAIAENINEFTGNPQGWNKQQLLQFFTPESINKLKNKVIGFIGASSPGSIIDYHLNEHTDRK